jgi:hydroxyacylglutathione hydrolase
MNQKPIVIALPGVNAYLLAVVPAPAPRVEDELLAAAAGPSIAAAAVIDSVTGYSNPTPNITPDSAAKAFVLIDTGFSFTWARVRKALQDAGCVPGTLQLIVITHGDLDHVGNVPKLREEYGAPVAIHPADVAAMQSGRPLKRTSPSLKGRLMLRLAGVVGRLTGGRRPDEPFAPDLLLEDGMRLDRYGLAARVIHIPGHTPGSVAILTDDGSLFSGDTLFDSLHPILLMENPNDFRCSVTTLCELQSVVTTVYPGHGKPFPGKNLGRIRV